MSKKPNDLLFPILLTIFAVLLTIIIQVTNLFEKVELKLYDYRMLFRGELSTEKSDIILIDINDDTCLELGERFPISRNLYAKLIDNLTKAGIKLIVFDIQFTEPDNKNPEFDKELAESIKNSGKVISAGKFFYEVQNGNFMPVEVRPIPEIEEASLDWGTVNELKDSDDVSRNYNLYVQRTNGSAKLSLGLQVIKNIFQVSKNENVKFEEGFFTYGKLKIPQSTGTNFLINYYGKIQAFKVWNFSNLIDTWDFDLQPDVNGQETDTDFMDLYIGDFEGIPDSIRKEIEAKNPFKDKIAIVGVSLAEAHDLKLTPFSDSDGHRILMPGFETHAHAIQTMLDNNFITKFSNGYTFWLIILLLGLLVSLIVVKMKNPLLAFLVVLLISFSHFLGSFWAFQKFNFAINIVSFQFVILISWISQSTYKLVLAIKERRQIEGMFGHYLHPKVIEQLKSNPQQLNLGGEEVEASVIFSDVKGFTSISEKLNNYELVALLNEYLTEMSDLIMNEIGIIDKYEGDAIMAEFGIPIPDKEHAIRACRAALRMKIRLKKLREVTWKNTNRPELFVRIGVNSGKMLAGNMGSKNVFDYTVMGDEVNLSSRLEGANKQFGTTVMIGENTYKLVKGQFFIRFLGNIKVKGKKEPKRVYELMDFIDSPFAETLKKVISWYEKGLALYVERRFGEAKLEFEKCIPFEVVDGELSPSLVYSRRCEEFTKNPPPENWDDITELTEK
ncbi:adenylate/guanylate cyclase domain-containing protein [bacterium]|nr:adenylate/guanylate cyclase domain-containing protein [bacterium]